jgi:hypothetical protein
MTYMARCGNRGLVPLILKHWRQMELGCQRQAPAILLTGKGPGTHFTADLVSPRTLLDGYRKEKFFLTPTLLGQISQPYRIVFLAL